MSLFSWMAERRVLLGVGVGEEGGIGWMGREEQEGEQEQEQDEERGAGGGGSKENMLIAV